jgi:peroxiredoxin
VKKLHIFIVSFFILLAILSCKNSNNNTIVRAGHEAPSFSLSTLDSKKINLAMYAGEYVLINFWATWCAPCIEELPDLNKLHDHFKDRGLRVLTIAVDDDLETMNEIVDELNLTLPILLDTEGVVKTSYKVRAFPETFLVDREGKIRLITDPKNMIPELKLRGPRAWFSDKSVELFNDLLEN